MYKLKTYIEKKLAIWRTKQAFKQAQSGKTRRASTLEDLIRQLEGIR